MPSHFLTNPSHLQTSTPVCQRARRYPRDYDSPIISIVLSAALHVIDGGYINYAASGPRPRDMCRL